MASSPKSFNKVMHFCWAKLLSTSSHHFTHGLLQQSIKQQQFGFCGFCFVFIFYKVGGYFSSYFLYIATSISTKTNGVWENTSHSPLSVFIQSCPSSCPLRLLQTWVHRSEPMGRSPWDSRLENKSSADNKTPSWTQNPCFLLKIKSLSPSFFPSRKASFPR